jgi:hypothetical protein
MSGDPTNASLWADADVLIAPVGSPIPADASTPFSVAWSLVGLLDGDKGFVHSRSQDVKDHYAWGGILVATTRAKYKQSVKFTVLEDNVTTRSVIWPGSSVGQIVVPKPGDILIALETRKGGKVHRLISANRAQVDVNGDITENETDMTAVELEATVYPDSTGLLFIEQGKPTIVSIALAPLTLALSLAGSKIKTIVATATYSDATTGNVTLAANWVSGTPANASVVDGYVTGLVIGTSSISCNYGGVTSTAPCVATVAA